MRSKILMGAVVTTMLLVLAGPAFAGAGVDDAVSHLRNTHVYVASDANPTISGDDAKALEDQINKTGKPIYITVLPDRVAGEVDNNYDNLPGALGKALGGNAVIGVVAGTHFRAGSSAGVGFGKGQAGEIATRAFNENNPGQNGGNITPMLRSFVDKTAQAFQKPASGSSSTSSSNGGSSTPVDRSWIWKVILGVVLLLIVVVSAVLFFEARAARKEEEERAARKRERDREERIVRRARSGSAKATVHNDDDGVEWDAPEAAVARRSFNTSYPAPQRTVVINQGYPGYNYGYHPGYGWGYYGYDGGFVNGMLMAEAMHDHHDHYDHDRHEESHSDSAPAESHDNGGDWGSSSGSSSSDNGGDWTSSAPSPSFSPPTPSYDPPSYSSPSYDPPSSGGDWGGGGGDVGGGGGGGGDW